MSGINTWMGIGHIVWDINDAKFPLYGQTLNGSIFYKNRIAVDASYKDKEGNKVQGADFIDIRAWNGTAEFLSKYAHKGSKVAITGRLKVENYTSIDKTTGEEKKGTSTYILIEKVELLDSKPSEKTVPAETPVQGQVFDNAETEFEGNPFEGM